MHIHSRSFLAFLLLHLCLSLTSSTAFAEDDPPLCQLRPFKPCTCAEAVSPDVSYRPEYPGCNGKAAILLRGQFLNVFSVVVRDNQNRDRWPRSGFNRCSFRLANSANPPARCSAFKVQKTYFTEDEEGAPLRVNCLGASGFSTLFQKVVRITAKLRDVPGSNLDPLKRWCLAGPKVPLN